jgi:hypothetical protein
MIRPPSRFAFAASLLLINVGLVRAQVNIDTSRLGFGGWNEVTNPRTSGAQGRALDAQTAMNVNEYIYQSSIEANKRYLKKLADRHKLVNETGETTLNRLRTSPSTSDVIRGDALNVAFDDITNPQDYGRTLDLSNAIAFAGTRIKSIPFKYASAAITTSLEDLTQPSATPALLKQPEFKSDLAAFVKLQAGFKARVEGDKPYSIESAEVARCKQLVKKMSQTLKDNAVKFRKGSTDYSDAQNYLKGLYIFVNMLETPSMTGLLSGVENRQDTTIADLLRFMHSANLRFGMGQDEHREIYTELYVILDGLRKDIGGGSRTMASAGTRKPVAKSAKLFAGMEKVDFGKLEDELKNLLPPPPEDLEKLLPPRFGRNRRLPFPGREEGRSGPPLLPRPR